LQYGNTLQIAGGGLAGCVVAGRLAEADRDLSILVIEQGPSSYNAPEVVYPALYPQNLFPSSKITLFWQTRKAPELANRAPIVPSGGTLGGGSAINWMVCLTGTDVAVVLTESMIGIHKSSAIRLRLLEDSWMECRRYDAVLEKGDIALDLTKS
jgi:hypothetical protein